MARIVSLTPLGRDKERIKAELGTGEELAVTVSHIADYGLYTGAELEEETLSRLRRDAERSRIRARALRILGSRAMSRRELVRSLTDKGEDEAAAEAAAEWAESLGLIDDREYAMAVVRHYAAKGYGLMRIRGELSRRGIDRSLWDEALSQLPEEMEEAAYQALEAILKGAPGDKAKLRRAGQALARRGFSWSEIQRALRRYTEEFGEEELDER